MPGPGGGGVWGDRVSSGGTVNSGGGHGDSPTAGSSRFMPTTWTLKGEFPV